MPRKKQKQKHKPVQRYYKVWLQLECVDQHSNTIEADIDLPFSCTATSMSMEKATNIAHDLHEIGRVLAARQNQSRRALPAFCSNCGEVCLPERD